MGSTIDLEDSYRGEIPRVVTSDAPEVMALLSNLSREGIYHAGLGGAALLAKVVEWRSQSKYIGLVAGVYDVLHNNHRWYLLEARFRLAENHINSQGGNFSELSDSEKLSAFFSTDLRLIVTVDDDAQVANGKGQSSSKPGIRPVLSWQDRARTVKSISIPVNDDYSLQVVSAVTVHSKYLGGIHSSDIELGRAIVPDTWLVATESFAKTGQAALEMIQQHNLPTKVVQMPNHVYELNPLTGNPYSTSDIVNRLMGNS